jgi:hypothetical protein
LFVSVLLNRNTGLFVAASASYDEKFALYALKYASTAYCPVENIAGWNCTLCSSNPTFELAAVLFDAGTNTVGYVGVDIGASKSSCLVFVLSIWNQQSVSLCDTVVIVAFRGTVPSSLKNWITDLNAAKLQDYDGIYGAKVHSGFYLAYTALAKQLKAPLAYLRSKYPTFGFLVTGHSLGGALADLAAVDSFSVFGSGADRYDLVFLCLSACLSL